MLFLLGENYQFTTELSNKDRLAILWRQTSKDNIARKKRWKSHSLRVGLRNVIVPWGRL